MEHPDTPAQIAEHLGLHYATVSRIVSRQDHARNKTCEHLECLQRPDTVIAFMSECGWMIRNPAPSWLAVGLLLSGGAAAADIEKWIDPAGGVHYGDQAPAGVDAVPVDIRPNVIEGDPVVTPDVGRRPAEAAASSGVSSAAPPEQRQDIKAYIEQCRNNRGVDCELEAHQMIDGPAPVIFPGDPAVFARPDLKPPPPGLPLKFQITP